MVLASEWLEENYPKNGVCKNSNFLDISYSNRGKKRNQVTILKIAGKKLEGEFNLSDFVNLETLSCREIN